MRALIIGIILCFIIGTADIYNLVKIQGSYMTIDFTTGFAIFFIFFITLFNYLFKKIFKKEGLKISELIVIYIMMIVSCSIPTMGLTLYLIPLIAGIKYYSNPQNEWDNLIIPNVKKSLIVQDENAIKWFFEGLPKGQNIPWISWIKPISLWIPLILSLYLAMIFIMVILHKQWSENERLNYPMTKAPIELINSENNNIFKNGLFWFGFLIPFIFGLINGLHFYFPNFPQAQLVKNIPIFRRTLGLSFRISFPMIGFTYFVSLPLAFSLWFFCLLTTIEQGFFNIVGLTFVYSSDVRTFVMASVANGLKIAEEIKGKKKIIFWAIIISIIITLFSSIWATIILCYKYGGINANQWFFVNGPQYPLKYIADKIKNPKGPDWLYIGFTGIGAVFTIFLLLMRLKFLNFPFHPLGFAFSTIMMTNALWFSIFITWLIKSMILRYGGAKIYDKFKNLFIGLIIGQFVISGLFLIVDFFTQRTGNTIFWA